MTTSSDVQVHRYNIDNLCLSKIFDLEKIETLIHYRFLEIIKWGTYIFYWFIWKVFKFYNNKTKDKGYSTILDQSQGYRFFVFNFLIYIRVYWP